METISRDFEEYVSGDVRRLHALAYGLTGNREDAEDLVQEALVRLHLAWSRLDSRGPHGYATTVLCRLATKRRYRRIPVDPSSGPELGATTTTQLVLRSAVRGLPPRQRAVIALRYLCDQTESQTAQILGCSVGTVKSQTSKALHSLQRFLESDKGEDAKTVGPLRTPLKTGRQQ